MLLPLVGQVFNNSPDETAYFRMLLNRENITNAAVMIQPSLISYSFNSLPQPALLDVASIAADRILLLDSYFSVVIFHGMTIAQWRNMGYQNQPEHQVYILICILLDLGLSLRFSAFKALAAYSLKQLQDTCTSCYYKLYSSDLASVPLSPRGSIEDT